MPADDIYGVLTQLGSLLRAESRAESGLQPVQVQVLHYLSICNRYSDTPAAVADYLGLTKGTVSQTLRVLAESGWVDKAADPDDGRVVHLKLTRSGEKRLGGVAPPRVLEDAVGRLTAAEQERTRDALLRLLRGLQQSNGGLTFGVCHTCSHFRTKAPGKFRCGLTEEPLAVRETRLICREHLVSAMR
ncbi:MAG: MarR family winged helix-turn-helix transcriptional regulator [Polyangiales bacterium]